MLSKWAFWRRETSSGPAASSVPAGLAQGRRLYAVGDIHGRADLLESLLALIEADIASRPAPDIALIFLGDYIDRGPDSCLVLERLMRGFPPDRKAVFLRGNHEETLLAFLEDPAAGADWRRFGGLETLASYGIDITQARLGRGFAAARDALAERLGPHLAFLKAMPVSAREGGYFFCHAGVRPGVPLAEQSARDLCWIRDEFLGSEADFGAIVVHGHTPCERVERRRNRINVDTGAYVSHRLSCVALEGSEVRVLEAQGA